MQHRNTKQPVTQHFIVYFAFTARYVLTFPITANTINTSLIPISVISRRFFHHFVAEQSTNDRSAVPENEKKKTSEFIKDHGIFTDPEKSGFRFNH